MFLRRAWAGKEHAHARGAGGRGGTRTEKPGMPLPSANACGNPLSSSVTPSNVVRANGATVLAGVPALGRLADTNDRRPLGTTAHHRSFHPFRPHMPLAFWATQDECTGYEGSEGRARRQAHLEQKAFRDDQRRVIRGHGVANHPGSSHVMGG